MTISDNWQRGAQGIFMRLPARDYHSAPGFSHSMSKHLNPPAMFPIYMRDKIRVTVEMIMGTLAHGATLEPDVAPPMLAIKPAQYPDAKGKMSDWHMGSNWCKAWVANQEAAGKIVLSQSEMDDVNGMVLSLTQNEDPKMRDLLTEIFEDCDTEVSIFQDAIVPIRVGGEMVDKTIMRKARVDVIPRKGNELLDIKTVPVGGSDPAEFRRKLYDMDYYCQAVSNLSIARDAGIEGKTHFTFITVEREEPYLVALHTLEPDCNALRLGALEWDRRLSTYAACAFFGKWPGYRAQRMPIDLEPYAVRELEAR